MNDRVNSNLMINALSSDRKASLMDVILGLPALIAIWTGTALLMRDLVGPAGMPAWAFGLIGFASSVLIMALSAAGIKRRIYPAVMLLIIICVLIFRQEVLSGSLTLINNVLDKLTLSHGRIYLDYPDAADTGGLMPAVLAVLMAVGAAAACIEGSLIPLLPQLLLTAAGTLTGVVPAGIGTVLLIIGVILAVSGGETVNVKAALSRTLACLMLAALAIGIGLLFRTADLSGIAGSVELRLHEIRYDSDTNSMPEGRLADLGPLRQTDAQALSVTMEKPQKLYLRGHVYEVYTGTSWEELPASDRVESESAFYWLHRGGFFGEGQIGMAMSVTDRDDTQNVKVENLSACRETSYLAYAIRDTAGLDESLIGDASWDSNITEYSIYNGSVSEWYEAQYRLVSQQGEDRTDEYMALEQSYAEYVKAHDLELTQESWNVLHRQLGDAEGSRSLYEIQNIIRKYLEKNLHYDEDVYTMSGKGDVLNYVLERSDGGAYSVQYATAAVLMLRYYGVPARYVEGYYLTPEQASQAEAGEPVILTEKNAHAWAEYYLNGVGFIPFEVTPGYIDPEDMDLDLGTSGNGAGDGLYQYQSNAMTYALTEEPEREEPETGQREMFRLRPELLLLALPLALIAFLIFVISRRIRLRNKLRSIDEAPNREALALRYGYAMAIKSRAPEIQASGDDEAAHLNELALFSRQEITDEDRKQMDEYAVEVLSEAGKTWGIFRKLKLRLIEGIY